MSALKRKAAGDNISTKKGRTKTKYDQQFECDYGWVRRCTTDDHKAECKVCGTTFSISKGMCSFSYYKL